MIGYGIWLALLGVLGAANLIIARKPSAKEIIGKISPYQGWIGAVSTLGGIWMVIFSIMSLGWLGWGMNGVISWVSMLATAVLEFALGLLLGVGVIKTFVKNPMAVEKMDMTITKLAPYQGTLGLIAIGVGVWTAVASIVFPPVPVLVYPGMIGY